VGAKKRLTGDVKCTKLSGGDTVWRTRDTSLVFMAVATPVINIIISKLVNQ